MNPWETYLRWRHRKGFGVHSPYAYRFITDVMNPGRYGYYAYHDLDFSHERFRHLEFERHAKFLIRLSVFLNSSRIVWIGRNDYAPQLVARSLKIKQADLNLSQSLSDKLEAGDLLLLFHDNIYGHGKYSPASVEKRILLYKEALQKELPVMAVNPPEELRFEMEKPLERGLLLDIRKNLLLIPRKEMMYTSYIL